MELSEVKRAVIKQSKVIYKEHEYIFYASRIYKKPNKDEEDYSAELLDLNSNSILEVKLKDVKLNE